VHDYPQNAMVVVGG